jgi:hypothetical protein
MILTYSDRSVSDPAILHDARTLTANALLAPWVLVQENVSILAVAA